MCPQSYALDLCLVFFRSSLACMTALCGPMCPSVSQYCNIAAEAHSDSAQSVGDCGSVEISPAVRTLHADLTCNTQPPHGWPAQDSLPPLVSTLQADSPPPQLRVGPRSQSPTSGELFRASPPRICSCWDTDDHLKREGKKIMTVKLRF